MSSNNLSSTLGKTMLNKRNKVKRPTLLLLLTIVDSVLIFFGRAIKILDFDFRYVLLILLMIISFIYLLSGYSLKSRYINFFAAYLFCLLYAFFIGTLRYPLKDCFEHIVGNMYIVLFIPFTLFIRNKKDLLYAVKILKCASLLVSLLTIFIFILNSLGFSIAEKFNLFLIQYDLGFVSNSGRFTRVFIRTIPYSACFLVMDIYKILIYKRITTSIVFFIMLNGIACFICFTMGLWIAILIALAYIIFLYFLYPKKKKESRILIKTPLFYFLLILAVALIPIMLETVLLRSHATDSSVMIKSDQFLYLLKEWSKHPIIGNGFGITRYFKNTGRTMIVVENFWMDTLSTMGIIGLICCLFFCFTPCLDAIRHYKKCNLETNFLLITFSSFIIIIAVTTIFNPFLNASVGLIILIFSMVSINLLLPNSKKLEINL